jgi:hypothetical protein
VFGGVSAVCLGVDTAGRLASALAVCSPYITERGANADKAYTPPKAERVKAVTKTRKAGILPIILVIRFLVFLLVFLL